MYQFKIMFLRFLVCEIADLMFLYNSQPYEMAKETLHTFLAERRNIHAKWSNTYIHTVVLFHTCLTPMPLLCNFSVAELNSLALFWFNSFTQHWLSMVWRHIMLWISVLHSFSSVGIIYFNYWHVINKEFYWVQTLCINNSNPLVNQ